MTGEAFFSRADIKAQLAQHNVDLHPQATIRSYPRPPAGNHNVVLLDRVGDGTRPDYCIHGYASCVRCHELCWLGHETEPAVSSGSAYPLCLDCARITLPGNATRVGSLHDRGPHD